MKRCLKCGIEKPLSEFYKNARGGGGLLAWCKDCVRRAQKKRDRARVRKGFNREVEATKRHVATVMQTAQEPCDLLDNCGICPPCRARIIVAELLGVDNATATA
jgi:hypothetical protein